MRFFNNKLANITSFICWEKVDYFNPSRVNEKDTIYMFSMIFYV